MVGDPLVARQLMNTKTCVFLLMLSQPFLVRLEGAAFQNLDFESPRLPLVPIPGDQYGRVPISSALPGWTGLIGTNEQSSVLYNNFFLGSSSIGLLGPGTGTIEGNYTLLLQAGVDINSGLPRSVTISQTGLVPADSQSLQFKALGHLFDIGGPNPFVVTLGGQSVNLVPISSSPQLYTLYAGDISSFAGTTATLEITALPFTTLGYTFSLDSITFSPIPEPSTWTISVIGWLLLGLGFWRRP